MPTPSEIRSKARNVNQVKEEIKRAKNKHQGEVNQTGTWWLGDAGQTYRNEYREIDTEIGRLITRLDGLESSLNGLATNVQRADDERRRKAEELRRQAEEKKRQEEEARRKASQPK